MSGPGRVLVETFEDGITAVTLERPEKRNALSVELREALAAALRRLAGEPSCRGVVLQGAGSTFCAGMDFTQFGGDRAHRQRLLGSTRAAFEALLELPKPIVCGVQGAALGGGFMLALCCDARIACESAYFGFYEVRRGIPAPLPIVRLFVDEARARDWCETGRRVEAREALEAGVLERLVAPEALSSECRREALGRCDSPRRRPLGLREAFADEMRRFERALFRTG